MTRKGVLILLSVYTLFVCAQNGNYDKGANAKGLIDLFLSPCKCKCGWSNQEARLLGGEFLKSHEFPWLALIHIKGLVTVPATLINDRYVISAASPLMGLTPYDVKVGLGAFDRCVPDVSTTNVSVEKILLHPDFEASNRAYDLSLLKLSTPVTVERRISPICLSTPGSTYLGQVATLVGWTAGPSQDGGLLSSCRPRKLGLPVLNQDDCATSAFDASGVSRDKGCAGVIGIPSVICKSDAGGPVMYRSYNGVYELIGVLTDKNDCNQKPGTILYTQINHHLGWIGQNTKDACFCFKV